MIVVRAPSLAEVCEIADLAMFVLLTAAVKRMFCQSAQTLRHRMPAG